MRAVKYSDMENTQRPPQHPALREKTVGQRLAEWLFATLAGVVGGIMLAVTIVTWIGDVRTLRDLIDVGPVHRLVDAAVAVGDVVGLGGAVLALLRAIEPLAGVIVVVAVGGAGGLVFWWFVVAAEQITGRLGPVSVVTLSAVYGAGGFFVAAVIAVPAWLSLTGAGPGVPSFAFLNLPLLLGFVLYGVVVSVPLIARAR